MQATRSRDSKPEMALRTAVHSLGLRYRVAARPISNLPRTADLVFRRARVAVFVDGCFFHGCPEHYRAPRANSTYWADKIGRNVTRDRDTTHRLELAGWLVVRVWEHEDPVFAATEIAKQIRARIHGPA
jgi:DNA mismatch endonuclease (patch repair protein)